MGMVILVSELVFGLVLELSNMSKSAKQIALSETIMR